MDNTEVVGLSFTQDADELRGMGVNGCESIRDGLPASSAIGTVPAKRFTR
jgi:hypothetical protein